MQARVSLTVRRCKEEVEEGSFGPLSLWQKGPDMLQVPDKGDKGPDLAAPVVAASKEFHHIESGVERGENT